MHAGASCGSYKRSRSQGTGNALQGSWRKVEGLRWYPRASQNDSRKCGQHGVQFTRFTFLPVWDRRQCRRDLHFIVFPPGELASVSGGNWSYLCEKVERAEKGENVEIANAHAVFLHVAEKIVGWQKRLGEYPTILLRAENPFRVRGNLASI